MDQHARALEMREELVAEADTFARALDQTGHVSDGQLPPVRGVDGAEHGLERRERVTRDLRLRVRDPRQKRRLARVRQADERGVGQQLEPQLDVRLLPGLADLCEPRRLASRGREAPVAAATRAAAREHDLRARALEVGHKLVALEHLCPGGHAQLDALAGGAVLARA